MVEDNIIISNVDKFSILKEKFISSGFSDLFVISDFDRTMTKSFVNGKMVSSLISILRSEDMLVKGYSEKAQKLFEKYHPIEIDGDLSISEKIPFMEEWWGKHGELLVESGLNKSDLDKISFSSDIVIRDNCVDCLKLLDLNKIPFIVLSASGAGDESVISCMRNRKMDFDNVSVISNKYVWDENDNAISRVKPYIHTFNKSGISIKNDADIFSKVFDRKNIILIGDSLGDCHMADGLDYNTILKIGFLNSDARNKLEDYKKHFDVVITGDSDFSFLLDFLQSFND